MEEKMEAKNLVVPGWLVPLTNITQLQKMIVAVLFESVEENGGKAALVDAKKIGERIGLPYDVVSKNIKKLEQIGLFLDKGVNVMQTN